MTTKPNRAALYTRLSRAQDEKVATVEVQEKNLRAEAKRRGLSVASEHVFSDDGISAFSGKERPGFLALLDAIYGGEIDYVLARDMTRISREEVEAAMFRRDCREAGVTMILDGREYGPDDEGSGLVAMIEAWQGNAESRKKSKNVKKAKKEAASLGRYNGGPRPFGYDVERDDDGNPKRSGNLLVIPKEAEAIREAVKRITDGSSLVSIAESWNRRGLRTSGSANLWTSPKVKSVIERPVIAGIRTHNGEKVGPGVWEPIVSPEDQARALAALRSRYRVPNSREGAKPGLLSGVIVCGVCGSRMTPRRYRGSRADAYSCQVDGGARCGKVGVQLPKTETLVAARLVARITSPEYLDALAARDAEEGEESVSELLQTIADLETETETLADEYGRGEITRSEWRIVRERVGERLATARKRLESAGPISAPAMLTGGADAWNSLDLDAQRAIVLAHVDRVVIATATPNGGKYDEARVDIRWRA